MSGEIKHKYLLGKPKSRRGVWSTRFLAEGPAHTKAQVPLSAISDHFATKGAIKEWYNYKVTDKIPWSSSCYLASVWARILADVSSCIVECIRAWATEVDCIGLDPGSATCQLSDLCKLPDLSVSHSFMQNMRTMTIMVYMGAVQI